MLFDAYYVPSLDGHQTLLLQLERVLARGLAADAGFIAYSVVCEYNTFLEPLPDDLENLLRGWMQCFHAIVRLLCKITGLDHLHKLEDVLALDVKSY